MLKFNGAKSNWEVIIFFLIQPLVSETRRRFTRSKMLGGKYDKVYLILALLGHKKKQTSIEQTIQKTIQKMRDKGWIKFLRSYSGEYELTDLGYEEMNRQMNNLNAIKNSSREEIEAANKIIENYSK